MFMWNQETAEEYLHSIQPILEQAGYNSEIVGSVKEKGFSNKDLDIALTPKNEEYNFEIIIEKIHGDFSMDQETYYTVLSDGRVVDFFIK